MTNSDRCSEGGAGTALACAWRRRLVLICHLQLPAPVARRIPRSLQSSGSRIIRRAAT
jgi:hypothetical protein